MKVEIKFGTPVNGVRKAQVPTGQLVITRVPRCGLMGVHRPWQGRSQVFVSAGKFRTIDDTMDALISEWRRHVGVDEIRSFV
jgi:hypothetical protein